MAATINLGAYGNAIGSLPSDVLNSAINDAKSSATALVQDTYRKASSSLPSSSSGINYSAMAKYASRSGGIQKLTTKEAIAAVPSRIVAPRILQTPSALLQAAKSEAQEFAAEMGASAAAGAQDTMTDTLKSWAPWIVGGVLVGGLGIWLLGR